MSVSLKEFIVDFFVQNVGSIHALYLIYWNVLASLAFLLTLVAAYAISRNVKPADETIFSNLR